MKILKREVWKAIPDFPGYEVSSLGRIRTFWKRVGRGKGNGRGAISIIADFPQRIMKTNPDKYDGYLNVVLRQGDKGITKTVHRLVLETFVGPCPEGYEARHLDNTPGNPDLTNLCWGTKSENHMDRIGNGTYMIGEKNPCAKLTNKQVVKIKRRLSEGESQSSLAKEQGVTRQVIWEIDHNKKWRNVA
jgi:hypothetical protein